MMKFLDKIDSPADLKGLSTDELRELCGEIREYMLECCATNPGHVGSSLGAVELIVGVHKVYNTPEDKLVFDVSHQSYAHKIITGRREAFRNKRQAGGISGFTRRDESPYDAFGAGHSSTSISASLGLAQAARMQGRSEKVIALIGDGALTGGLAYEGLDNVGGTDTDLLIILNDNNISIDRNIGSMHEYLLRITTSVRYNRFKERIWHSMGETGFRRRIQKMVRDLKSNLTRQSGGALFESMGFRYFGPIDGNDIAQVTETLTRLRGIKGPKILHAITTKGKGFAPAEEDQTTWHAPGAFDPVTGKRIRKHSDVSRYQDVFGEVLLELARMDSRVVGVTPAMASGCGMNLLAGEMPERFFDVGIAEGHAVTFSAGLAAGGMRPFCNIYSSFSQRAYDMIIHDVALQKLPVVLCFDRAGLVGEDGATHHGCFDIAAYRSIPDTVIAVPSDEIQLKQMMYSALHAEKGPYIIRYPRGYGKGAAWQDAPFEMIETGKALKVADGGKAAILVAGPFVKEALEAAEEFGDVAVYDLRFVKPLDEEAVMEAARTGRIVTVEDGSIRGGLFGAVTELLAEKECSCKVRAIGIPDRFVGHASQSALREECGLDKAGILRELKLITK
ncbi:MAG: 1-deoxy-D-xylulose-5-phosphate synthase [Bacteroidales bacterium]|nr:1-deoxy-D-xylulose-5-phosphate synthase [Bacteroidales bacterium]